MARRGKRTLVRAAMGFLSMLVGALLTLRPLSAPSLLVVSIAIGLAVAAFAEIVQGTREAPARWLLGGMYLFGAMILLIWPEVPVMAIGAVVGLLLVATGALEVWSGLLSRTRLPAMLVGAAAGGLTVALVTGVVTGLLGVLTALWADVVLLPMTITLGFRLILVGAGLLIDLWYPPTGLGAPTERQRLSWRLIGLGLATALLFAGIAADHQRPYPSEFYYRDIPADTAAGSLLRADAYAEGTVPAGMAIRVLYATYDATGTAVAASAVVYVPYSTTSAQLPVVVWAHSETGSTQGCAPSVIGEAAGGLSVVPQLLAAGYAVIAPDYPGLGTAGVPSYLVGVAEGRSLLDAVRAAAQIPGLRLGSVALWGHSQGGHAALWAAQLAADYAPGVKIAGVAVDGPVVDPAALLAGSPTSDRASQLLASYAANYPEVLVSDYLDPGQRAVATETAHRCGGAGWAMQNWVSVAGVGPNWLASPAQGPLAARLAQNIPTTTSAPLLVTQGDADQVITRQSTDAWVAWLCRAGQSVDYRTYPGLGHQSPARADSPQLPAVQAWLGDRFAGRTAQTTCSQSR